MTVDKFTKTLSPTKFRVFSQGDVLILKCISTLEDTSASQLMLCVTMAQGKMFSLSQISPILKTLVKQGLIVAQKTVSEQTNRDMLVYSLTKKGEAVLELSEKLLDTLSRKT